MATILAVVFFITTLLAIVPIIGLRLLLKDEELIMVINRKSSPGYRVHGSKSLLKAFVNHVNSKDNK